MKKQFPILTAIFISVAIVSCSKQEIEVPATTKTVTEEISMSSSSAGRTLDPLLVNLDGWFAFNGNLKDQLKKLPDGVSTGRGSLYTADRKGTPKAAIKFNGSYGVNLFKVPQQTHASISVWVKYDNPNLGTGRAIVKPKTTGLGVGKKQTEISGSVEEPNHSLGIRVENVDNNWHHFVVTFDDDKLRLYMDGQLITYTGNDITYPKLFEDYFVGYRNNEWFEGSVDDLRFYSRTLSATDVQALYKL